MIAQPERHFEADLLRQLLDETLPRAQAQELEVHLSHCDCCRNDLERIAGTPDWWNETADVLSDSSILTAPSPDSPTVAIDPSVQWIRPLLETSSNGGIGRIDDYPIHGVIGQGGMGVVLRGTDLQLNRPVALKILSPHLAGVGAARARFMREAQAAAAIVHPSIVPIYRVVTSSPLPYIVMPCIDGGNLQQRIDREGPLEISEVLRIGRQIAEGLVAAHRHGVIHRDIKPANVLIEAGNGRVLISDFGLARAIDDASLTVSGMIAGTPQYMSPEQARGESIDARSDLFSLGSLLYTLVTGRPPFRAESPLAVLRKISESRPRPIHQVDERIPAWVDALVAQFMQIDVQKRIASAEIAAQLLADAQAHVCNPSTHPLPKGLTKPWYRSASFIAATVCSSLALIIALIGFTIWQQPESTPRADTKISAPPPPWVDTAMQSELQSIQQQLTELEKSIVQP